MRMNALRCVREGEKGASMASPNLELLTPEEYLKRERAALEKSEYYEGTLVAMAGAQLRHNIITRNVLVAMTNRVKGSPCQAIS